MAIAPTGDIFKGLEFDGESSKAYGVYITGEAVFNAPEREVEMIAIPGRNGAFALDRGRFENIEVTYPAGIYTDSEFDFASAISDFRNFLCSRKGYVRLTDDYNPDEYRLAIYKSGLEVSPAQLKAGQFDIIFECQPQRFFMSGESAIDISSGDVVLNPTMFEASPMLEVEGYGSIDVNGYGIELNNVVVGDVTLADAQGLQGNAISFSTALLEANDIITLNGFTIRITAALKTPTTATITGFTVTTQTGSDFDYISSEYGAVEEKSRTRVVTFDSMDTTGLLGSTTKYCNLKGNVGYEIGGSSSVLHFDLSIGVKLETVDATTKRLRFVLNTSNVDSELTVRRPIDVGAITAVSTQTLLGHPTYIDCDLGAAYKVVDGEPVSLNSYIDLGSKLPELSPGANTITFDNTITDLKVVPHWWKV